MAWVKWVGGALGVLALVVAALFFGLWIGEGKSSPDSEEPDRVINAVLKCDLYNRRADDVRPAVGDECEAKGVQNVRYDVTIRAASGDTYQVEYSPPRAAIHQQLTGPMN